MKADGADEAPETAGQSSARPDADRDAAQWAMEHGLRQRAYGRWPLVSDADGARPYTRESLALVADRSLTGVNVAATLSLI